MRTPPVFVEARLCTIARSVCVLAPVTLLCSCTLGPDFAPPTTPAPDGWKLVTASSEAIPTDWWRLFEDATLSALIDRALADNQDLRVALARVDQARAIARQSEADFYPSITLDPSIHRDRFSANRAVAPGARAGAYTTTTVSVPFDLSYEIDVWGRVRRSFEAAGAVAEASELDRQAVSLTITADVARVYFALRALDQEHAVLVEAVALRSKAVEILQGRFDSGIGNEVDLSRAKTELATAQADLRSVLRRRSAQENALAVLCGQAAPSFGVDRATDPVRSVPVPVALPSELLTRRPDIAAAVARLHEASARIGVAQAAFYPRFMLTGAAGTVSADLQSVFDPSSRAWSIGPSIALPIFEGGRNDARLQQAEALLRERDASYRQTLLVAFREVQDALSALDQLKQELEFESQAQQAADRTFELANGRFAQGLVSYLDVVDAARSQLDARRNSVRLRAVQIESTVLLIKALGGGWRPAEPAPPRVREQSAQRAAE
jgi:multidrug efflux system outer membrane protein